MAVVILETAFARMKRTILFLTGISIIFVLFSGCVQENTPSEESGDESGNYTIYNYSTPGFEITQTQASAAWEKVKSSDDAKFVTREKNYSVTVFVQPYDRVSFAHSPFYLHSAEWIVVTSSIPEKTEDVKIAIFRLDYQTLGFKRSYYFSYPQTKELTIQQSIAVMEEELKKEPGGSQPINESAVMMRDGNYIYSYLSPDFVETIHLFSWDEVPGKDNERLMYFLWREHDIHETRNKIIEKIDNNTIKVIDGGKTVLLRLNDEKTKLTLKIDDGRTAELVARMENGKLNIYGATTDKGPTIILNKYAGRILFHAIFRAGNKIWIKEAGNEPGGMFIFPEEEITGTALLPLIETRVESVSSPAYRGTSTVAKLSFAANNNPPNGSEIKVDYKTEVMHADGSPQSENNGFSIIPEKNKLVFPGREGQQTAYSNLTIKTSPKAAEGDYLITITSRYRGLVAGRIVLSFKIGKGGKKSAGKSMTEGSQNIGYSADKPLPLSEIEKAEMTVIATNDTYLKGKYKLMGATSEYLDLQDYSGFFAVVTVDVGDPDYPGEIIRYIVDREEKKIIGNISTPRKALEYFRGEAFDEAKGNFTKRWDAWNFPGLWLDHETNASTETLVIDQSLLNNNYRRIDRHNLIYKTNLVPLKYQIFAQANRIPKGTDGSYQAIGWMGEKHVYLQGNRLAKIIFEQNASDVKTMETMESWNMGEGYRLQASSIDGKTPEHQAWFTFFKDNIKLFDKVLSYNYELPPYDTLRYPELFNQNDTPVFIAYLIQVYAGRYTDNADFKYAWLRSQKTSEIKVGQIYGIMEMISVDNGRIELRNRAPLELAPDSVVSLMGNLNIKVGSSNTSLAFHPYKVKYPNDT